MRKVEHAHVKSGGKSFIRKVLEIGCLIWIVGFIGSAILIYSKQFTGIWFEIFCWAVLIFIVYRVYKIFAGSRVPKVPSFLKPYIDKVIPNQIKDFQQQKNSNSLNLKLNNTVDIINPFAGVFISGGAGAGKSKSIIEPLIKEAGTKGFTGVVYDFKFPELASYVNTAYQNSEVKPYFINFTDLTRSNRINPIAPELMQNESFAREYAFTILANLNPSMISKPDFWSDNATSLLASVFWFLRKRYPDFCTLPHAMSMVLQPDLEALLRVLMQEPKCADMIAPILTAYENKADNQLAGVISSLQVSLSKINTEEVYYLTSESDFSLDLNNPQSKGILVIGNNPVLASTYAPIIGLILTSISKQLNQQGKEKSVFMIDEFPTVYVPNVEQLPATARSNKVATILACQDIAQVVDKYGRDKSDTILSNLGNQFYGRTTNPTTAQRVSQMFGKADKLMRTDSKNYDRSLVGEFRKGSGQSFSYQERDLVKIQDVATLPTGSFYTILSEGKERQGLASIPMDKSFNKTDILPFKSVIDSDLDRSYMKIKKDVEYILSRT